ncbi:MAG: hypothetical protein LIP06_11540 [Tannerellaceae bacterium]|nr:hypothetical protein [Tannerellaceae bacterium]
MDDAEKRVKKTVDKMPGHELYGYGEAGVLTDEAQKKASTLEKEAKEKTQKRIRNKGSRSSSVEGDLAKADLRLQSVVVGRFYFIFNHLKTGDLTPLLRGVGGVSRK